MNNYFATNNKRYYLLYIGFTTGGKFYKFSESKKAKAMSLKRKYDMQGIYTELKVIEPKPKTTQQMSFFETTK